MPNSAGGTGDGGPATIGKLQFPLGISVDSGGGIYVADTGNNAVRYITPNGTLLRVANAAGTSGYSGDGGDALLAQLNSPVCPA